MGIRIDDAPPERDLDEEVEIAQMVRRFYQGVAQDDVLGPVFNDVAEVDWSTHLPKLTAFWCRILLGQPGYAGNPFRAHVETHEMMSEAGPGFTHAHFERWLDLFHDTVEGGWNGPKATTANKRATGMAWAMAQRFLGHGVWRPADRR